MKQQRLSYQLLRIVFSIYFMVAILVTAFHVYLTYDDAKEQISSELVAIENSFKPAFATAIWELNDEQLKTIAIGVLDVNFITGLSIVDPNGKSLYSAGDSNDEAGRKLFYHEFEVKKRTFENTYHLADVRLYSSSDMVIERIYVGVALLIINAVIKTIVLWLLLLWAFKKYIFRPLDALVNELDKFDLDHPQEKVIDLEIKQSNEFRQIESSFNSMIKKIFSQLGEITKEREKREKELQRHHSQLELKVAEQTKGLREAKEVAEEAVKTKSEFLANISHEVRTPMNGLMTTLKVLKTTDGLDQKQFEYIGNIEKSGNRMIAILDDLLSYSQIEKGIIPEYEIIHLPTFAKDLHSFYFAQAQEKELDLKYELQDVPDRVLTDGKLLSQIISNFISNAIKYTGKGEVIFSLSATNISNDKCTLKISVSDTGKGIAPDQLKTIFERFHQVESKYNKSYEGIGLGLSICRQISKILKGTITVSSELNEGSVFGFTYDVDITYVDKYDRVYPETVSLQHKLKFLLVEDDKIAAFATKTLLENEGHTVFIATNGQEAIETLENGEKFDLILMDVHMPVLDGLDATRRIVSHTSESIRLTPIIGLTASISEHERNQYLSVGMKSIVPKPLDLNKLGNSIRDVLLVN